MDFLDALRGLAASAVALQHFGVALFASFATFTGTFFQLGQFGVTVFFLCSGFVIPISIERTDGLARFWWHRIFRLYPLYWVSLLAATWLFLIGNPVEQVGYGSNLSLNFLANLTMLQAWIGQPQAISVYWSLGFEMIFYAGFSLLVFTKRSSLVPWICGLLLGLAVLLPLGFLALHIRPKAGLLFHFATMFFGTLLYRNYQGRLSTQATLRFLSFAALAIVAINFLSFGLHPELDDGGGLHKFLPMSVAWLGAYGLFAGFYYFRNAHFARPLTQLGKISYSVYLVHPIVIVTIPHGPSPLLTLGLWVVATIVISTISYYLIEKPFIRWAHAGWGKFSSLKLV